MIDFTTHFVYRIVCFATGDVYVGRTFDPQERCKAHFKALKYGRHFNSRLQNAYNKYRVGSFYFEIIESNIASDLIEERERYWIAYFDSYCNGFNATPGGDAITNTGIPCVWNGVSYPTIADAARAAGVTKASMCIRIKKGYTGDADMPGRNGTTKQKCMWNGIEYASINECARANNVDVQSICNWLKKGFSKTSDVPPKKVRCVWDGNEYASIAEAARITGIPKTTLSRYIKQGHSDTFK